MAHYRSVNRVLRAMPTREGAGVHLHRVFGYNELPEFDPFLLMDDFSGENPSQYERGFPWHPHRGIETITYMLRGEVEHQDSMGNHGVIGASDVQWMTAGSGIIHQEMPFGDSEGRVQGFQLWANLPAADKMMAPRYREVKGEEIPETVLPEGGRVRIIAGSFKGTHGPITDVVTLPTYLDISLPPGAPCELPVPEEENSFAYIVKGSVEVVTPEHAGAQMAENGAAAGHLIHFTRGSHLRLKAGPEGARLLLISGRPIGEPIAWHGPIVMNHQHEIATALREYQQGTFLKG